MKKDLTKVRDLTASEIEGIVHRAFEFKQKSELGVKAENLLGGKVVAMVFEKPSLRTKVAFEVAAVSLGGTPVFLSSSQILASGSNAHGRESIPDIARNLERFCDLILARVYSHTVIQEIAAAIKTPVINALCDQHHPTQALADLMAIIWHKKLHKGRKVTFIGDGNNVATSLMEICALSGMHFSVASPVGFEIPLKEREPALAAARRNGTTITFANDPVVAATGADVVYTDTFVSMGQEAEMAARLASFEGFQVNSALMKHAKRDALFMHCLPAHRGEEVTNEVFDGKQSIVFDQAECRLHIAKALLATYLS